jgi:subtilisin family serine protease
MPLRKCPHHRVSSKAVNTMYGYPIGVTECNSFLLWNEGYKGQGVKIGVIDSGIKSHSDLNDNVVFRKTFVGPIVESHGTHVAGTIAANAKDGYGLYGVAPEAKLYDIQILGKDGGSESDFLKAILLAVSLNLDILNCSIGSDYDDPRLQEAIKIAENANILVVCASGNEGSDTIVYPGAYEWCISVANWDVRHLVRHATSSSNIFVDICANGTDVISTEDNDGYAIYTGTSMASPHVTGLLALYIQMIRKTSPNLSKKRVASLAKEMLYSNTIDLLPPGNDKFSGHGEAKYNPTSNEKFNGVLRDDLYYESSKLN